jgi:hypothetical protein
MKQSLLRSATIALAAVTVTASAWGVTTLAHSATGTLTPAIAQQGGGQGSAAFKKYTDAQIKILFGLKPPLTDKQKADFKKLREDNMAEGRRRRASGETPNPDPQVRRKMGEARRAEYMKKLGKILTPGQLKQYDDQMKAFMKANPPQRRPQ